MNEMRMTGSKARNFWYQNSQVVMICLFTIAIMLVAAVLDKDFLSVRNLNNLILNAFPIMVVSFGQMLIILTGGIDLSIGNMVSLCNVVCVAAMRKDDPAGFAYGIVAALMTGALCGAFNGLLVTKARLTPVIATIATMSLFGGLALYIRPVPGGDVPSVFAKFVLGKSGFPTHIVLMLLVIFAVWTLTSFSPLGKKIRAVGGNEEAAYSTGVAVNRVKMTAYTLAGLLTAIAGVFLTAQMRSGDATVGSSYSMNSITVAVVGGTLLSGAVGNVYGTVAGAFMLMVLNNILNLVGVSSFYQYVFQGMILIAALAISSFRAKK